MRSKRQTQGGRVRGGGLRASCAVRRQGRNMRLVQTVLRAAQKVAATQGKGRLRQGDGRQAGFSEEVTVDRALRPWSPGPKQDPTVRPCPRTPHSHGRTGGAGHLPRFAHVAAQAGASPRGCGMSKRWSKDVNPVQLDSKSQALPAHLTRDSGRVSARRCCARVPASAARLWAHLPAHLQR